MAVIDTSTFIDASKGDPQAIAAIRNLDQNGEDLAISTISIFELSAGTPAGLDHLRRKQLDTLRVIELDATIAEQAGVIFRKLKQNGLEISIQDCMIAATATTQKQALVTANAKHFQRIPGLQIITY